MIRIFSRQIEKLHSQEGQALVFVAMVGLLIFLFFAMTMNLAEMVQLKIKNQNTADAAALSGAVWQARVLNTVSAVNRNLMNWWISLVAEAGVLSGTVWFAILACCGGNCVTNPACGGALVFTIYEVVASLILWTNAMVAGGLQNDVLTSFDEAFLATDLQNVVNLNFDFKENAIALDDEHPDGIDTELFVYLNENNGNIFLENGGGPGVDYVVERGGLCELIVGIEYNYLGSVAGSVEAWYQPGGMCYGSSLANSPFAGYQGIPNLFPYVLRTFRNTPGYTPVNPEQALPITAGVYREARPPVLNLWGQGSRKDLECSEAPDDVFPCTSQGHYSLASAHAYSHRVRDFYWLLYSGAIIPAFNTAYPIPVVPAETDWEARLFPLEPLTEQGGQSPHNGSVAYSDIAAQVEADEQLGSEAATFFRDNVLKDPDHPGKDLFLY